MHLVPLCRLTPRPSVDLNVRDSAIVISQQHEENGEKNIDEDVGEEEEFPNEGEENADTERLEEVQNDYICKTPFSRIAW